MNKSVVIIGAGINGLVAANYLARVGFAVTVLERKNSPGGACCAGILEHEGKKYEYPQGASVLGFMQDFVFEETGLSQRISMFSPEHPEVLYARQGAGLWWDDPDKLKKEVAAKWGEQGDFVRFFDDFEKVVAFLRKGYREAVVPTLESATSALGKELVDAWIAGSARDLLNRYVTSEPVKLFCAVSAIESGPVSLDSPYSAFSIPLMASGGIFGGRWGYVKGGIWQVPLVLDQINEELGVRRIFSARVIKVRGSEVTYEHDGVEQVLAADTIIFATDPLTAARIIDDQGLIKTISEKTLLGSSGKLIMFFKKPVRWKGDTGMKDFQSAFRHVIPVASLQELDDATQSVRAQQVDFAPAFYEVYCEGEGDRQLGGTRDYHLVSVFFTSVGFGKRGIEMPEVKERATKAILEYVENTEDLMQVVLETPKDISELFFFPQGNIDAVELTEGQTFFSRNYSPDPDKNFYQFGDNPNVYYCAAGSYPCGSVAGTPGYMCAQQIINKNA